jgi:hypothetical protein
MDHPLDAAVDTLDRRATSRVTAVVAAAAIAVTGGTGRYEGARGSIVSVGGKTGFARDTIHLLP